MRLLFGERYIKDPFIINTVGNIDSGHLFVFETRYEFNPLWTAHGHVQWDAEESELEEWQVGATRDLHDFILDFGYNVRNSSLRNSNKEIYFNFSMKAFPILSLRSGAGRATFADPRIGETVSGANIYGSRAEPFDQNLASA